MTKDAERLPKARPRGWRIFGELSAQILCPFLSGLVRLFGVESSSQILHMNPSYDLQIFCALSFQKFLILRKSNLSAFSFDPTHPPSSETSSPCPWAPPWAPTCQTCSEPCALRPLLVDLGIADPRSDTFHPLCPYQGRLTPAQE